MRPPITITTTGSIDQTITIAITQEFWEAYYYYYYSTNASLLLLLLLVIV